MLKKCSKEKVTHRSRKSTQRGKSLKFELSNFLNELRLAEAHFGKASYLSGDNNRGLSSGKCLEVDFSSFNRAPIETYTNVENLANEFECIALPCMNTVYWISNVLPGSDSN